MELIGMMTSSNNKEFNNTFSEYANLLERGLAMEVIEKFYSEAIIQFEDNTDIFIGKDRLKKIIFPKINSFTRELDNMTIDGDKGFVWGEMIIRYDSKKSGKKKLTEAFFQKRISGKIIEQRFYYKKIEDDK